MPAELNFHLPPGTVAVASGILFTVWVLQWQAIVVSRHRKRAGIKYPQLYAEKSEMDKSRDALLFNCAQRAHQNTLENMPFILSTTLLTSMSYPYYAGYSCGFWAFTRVLYTLGYITGEPAKRITHGGALGEIPVLALLVGSTYSVY